MKNFYKKGFTLIELLVVISIIGLLAAIIAVNVRSAQVKARDKAVIGSMGTLRAGGDVYFSNYNTYSNYCSPGNCTGGSPDWRGACLSIEANNGNNSLTCTTTVSTWCVSSALVGGGNYCVDSNKNGAATTCKAATGLCY